MLTRLKAYFPVLLIFLLAGCGGGEKRQAVIQPPPAPAPTPRQAAPPAVEKPTPPPSAPATAAVANPAPAKPAPPEPDAVGMLVTHAEVLYAAGMKDYQAGNMDNARQDFDAALSILLQSKYNVASDARLSDEFDKLVENIHSLEVVTLGRGDALSDQKYEPAPIESFSDLTFSVDPRVKQRVQEQLHSVHSDLPLVSNDYVDGVITYFQGRGHGFVEKVLSNAGLYQPMISEALRKEGLPQDLIYLAGAESTFNPFALSRAGAKGIWQLMLSRGMEYGLKKDRWVDEREDPVKSTQAATQHLHDLFQEFGDWYLAMAAYNCGPVTVQRAIERTGYADYWELLRLHALPRETENYVPIILATALIAKTPQAYGFDPHPQAPIAPDHVVVDAPTDLRLVAQLIDRPVEDVIRLNPSLLRWTTPANDPAFVLNLPAGTAGTYKRAVASIPADRRVWWRVHTVGDGETLASIAKKYRITKTALVRANQIDPDDTLTEGARLVLPLPEGRESSLVRVHERVRRRLLHYRVRPGDTLELIADRFDVTPYEIRRWNRMRSSDLMAGAVLRVYAATGGAYRPRRPARRKTNPHATARWKRSTLQMRKGRSGSSAKGEVAQTAR